MFDQIIRKKILEIESGLSIKHIYVELNKTENIKQNLDSLTNNS